MITAEQARKNYSEPEFDKLIDQIDKYITFRAKTSNECEVWVPQRWAGRIRRELEEHGFNTICDWPHDRPDSWTITISW